MELSTEEIQESTDKGMGWHGETSLHVRGEKHSLPGARRGLDLPFLRQPPRPIADQPIHDEPVDVVERGGRRELVALDPPGREHGSRARCLPPLRRLLRFLKLRRLVFRHRRQALQR